MYKIHIIIRVKIRDVGSDVISEVRVNLPP